MVLNLYLIGTTIIFMFLCMVWTRSSWANVFLKFTFFLVSLSGVYLSAQVLGLLK